MTNPDMDQTEMERAFEKWRNDNPNSKYWDNILKDFCFSKSIEQAIKEGYEAGWSAQQDKQGGV